MRTSLLALLLVWPAACGGESASVGAAVVKGTTIDALTREPLADVAVEGPGGRATRSDSQGRFRLAGLEPGRGGELRAHTAEGWAASVPLRPLAAGELEIVVALRPAPPADPGTEPHDR